MTGKELKELVATIPDDVEVIIGDGRLVIIDTKKLPKTN